MRLISIRKYLNGGDVSRDGDQPDCAAFCLGLLEQVGRDLEGCAGWDEVTREWAAADRPAASVDFAQRTGEMLCRMQRERQESSSKQTSEMQNLLIALNQALLSMSDRSEHGVKQLRQIEVRLRTASQSNDLGSLKASLRDTIAFVASEADRQRVETSSLLERMDKDMATARAAVLSSSLTLPGKEEAVSALGRLCSTPDAPRMLGVLARFGNLRLLAGRYNTGLVEDLMWRAAQTLRTTALDHRVYRWHFEALAWVVQADSSLSAARAQLESSLGQPWEHRGIANGRTVLLSVPLTWMSVALAEAPAGSITEQMERFCPGA